MDLNSNPSNSNKRRIRSRISRQLAESSDRIVPHLGMMNFSTLSEMREVLTRIFDYFKRSAFNEMLGPLGID